MISPIPQEYMAELYRAQAERDTITKLETEAKPFEIRLGQAKLLDRPENEVLQNCINGANRRVHTNSSEISYLPEYDYRNPHKTFTLAELMRLDSLGIVDTKAGYVVQNGEVKQQENLKSEHVLILNNMPEHVLKLSTMQRDGMPNNPENLDVIALSLVKLTSN